MKIIKRNLAVQLYTSNFVKAQFPSSFLQKTNVLYNIDFRVNDKTELQQCF